MRLPCTYEYALCAPRQDTAASDGQSWTVDEAQRAKLGELQASGRLPTTRQTGNRWPAPLHPTTPRDTSPDTQHAPPHATRLPCKRLPLWRQTALGLTSPRWTPLAVLGLLLAACGCARELNDVPFFGEVLRSLRSAHRDEILNDT